MIKLVILSLILMNLGACSSINFYTQAVVGQMKLLTSRQPVEAVLLDPDVNENLKTKLKLTQDILLFAEQELGLPVEGSYSSFVDTGQKYVVWNVFAAPEFSLQMREFCYPIAGCVTYRGFFKEPKAQAFAEQLKAEGLDVFVGGVSAYSTLGWFDDPILNTFLVRNDVRLAALLFHELSHKVVYVPGDTRFNESFATAVERVSLRRWLKFRNNAEAFTTYTASAMRYQQVLALISQTRTELAEIYKLQIDSEAMLSLKNQAFEKLKLAYSALYKSWKAETNLAPAQQFTEFRFWMANKLDNARIGTVADYNGWVPAFERLYENNDENLQKFFIASRDLSNLTSEQRLVELQRLTVGAGLKSNRHR